MTVVRAFMVRDFRVAWSYRLSFLTQNVGLLFSLVSLKFVGELVDTGSSADLEPYGGDYFAFALIGMSVSLLSYPAVKSFAGAVRASQVTGTFEAMLMTRASPVGIVLSGGAYAVAAALAQLLIAILVGLALFHAGLKLDSFAAVVLVLVLTLGSLVGLGLLAAAFVVAFKQPEPLSGGLLVVSLMLSGGLYPPSVLPDWIEVFSPLLPLTHALELSRQFLLTGASQDAVALHFGALLLSCLTIPAGIVALHAAMRHARSTGSLAQY